MDKVLSRHTHFKRALEKQLDEIEVRQRQSEARRLKQIRDLGVDLSRIHKTSRDLESTGDLAPRRHSQRRGSLPALGSAGAAYFCLEQPSRATRMGRRYSCIGSIRLPPPDVQEENSEHANSEEALSAPAESAAQFVSILTRPGEGRSAAMSASDEHRQDSNNKDLTNIQTTNSTKHLQEKISISDSAEADSSSSSLRRGSFDTSDNQRKNSNNDGHNVTTVFVHRDNQFTSKEKSPPDEETSEADSASMFQIMRNRSRRKSEPAVGGFFIRRLQATAISDILSFQQRNSADGEELRRSIQVNLPSNIVAEKDEDDKEGIDANSSLEGATGLPTGFQQKLKLSSISEHDQDGDHHTYSLFANENESEAASKDRQTISKFNQISRRTGNFPGYRARRNSDGDVLSYSYAKKLGEMKSQAARARGSASKSGMNKNSDDGDNESNDIWETVRKCRYLRGCDIPELSEPPDVTEFVFGRERNDSLPPISK